MLVFHKYKIFYQHFFLIKLVLPQNISGLKLKHFASAALFQGLPNLAYII
jgi:hypothetical protein